MIDQYLITFALIKIVIGQQFCLNSKMREQLGTLLGFMMPK
jgi:hypothetical protein